MNISRKRMGRKNTSASPIRYPQRSHPIRNSVLRITSCFRRRSHRCRLPTSLRRSSSLLRRRLLLARVRHHLSCQKKTLKQHKKSTKSKIQRQQTKKQKRNLKTPRNQENRLRFRDRMRVLRGARVLILRLLLIYLGFFVFFSPSFDESKEWRVKRVSLAQGYQVFIDGGIRYCLPRGSRWWGDWDLTVRSHPTF